MHYSAYQFPNGHRIRAQSVFDLRRIHIKIFSSPFFLALLLAR